MSRKSKAVAPPSVLMLNHVTIQQQQEEQQQQHQSVKFHEATHIVRQLYGVPHGILHVFSTILYENEFQNPQIFQQTISLFLDHSTLVLIEMILGRRSVINAT
jgi:hypothetical protein